MTARQIAAEAAALARWMPHAADRRRLPFALLLLGLLSAPGVVGDVARSALFDAYIGVAVFVAATLVLFYGLERALRIDAAVVLSRHRRWQVPAAAALGALPGCGGAIIVVSAYSRGRIGFGAVIEGALVHAGVEESGRGWRARRGHGTSRTSRLEFPATRSQRVTAWRTGPVAPRGKQEP